MTVCVLKATGDQTVPCLVTAKMEHHAPQMKESVNVHLATEALLAKEVSFTSYHTGKQNSTV